MNIDDFISKFERRVKTGKGFMVRCPAHEDSTASMSVCSGNDGRLLLKCFAGCTVEAIVGALGLRMQDLFPNTAPKAFIVPPAAKKVNGANGEHPDVKPTISKTYSYRTVDGDEAYQVVRMVPKSFRQRHMVDGSWVWNMEGVERILYRLPEISKATRVWICEGEKDADNLSELGFCATTNVGGGGKWLDSYSESLVGKEIVLCGDNDKTGQEHVKRVFDSLSSSAKNIRIFRVPDPHKDISDFIASFDEKEKSKLAIESLFDSCAPHINGHRLPLFSIRELERKYQRFVNRIETESFNLGKWLPSLGALRPLWPGEFAVIIGDTGTGKTALLSEISRAACPLPTLLFELELPDELMFERLLSAKLGMPCTDIELGYRSGQSLDPILDKNFKNLLMCTEPRITLKRLEEYINRSELKLGQRPRLVLLDYIQLMEAEGPNRREKMSDVSEGLKIIAKSTQTIIIASSQVKRLNDEQIGLHSAKETSSIESSCGLLLGAWRDSSNPAVLNIQVLKSTKGGTGLTVKCNFRGDMMRLDEMVNGPIEKEDVPNRIAKFAPEYEPT